MKFIPSSLSRKLAEQALVARKNSPTILFGVGMVSMVGSTVMACRATLKVEEILDEIQGDKDKVHRVKELLESEEYTGDQTYTDAEVKKDLWVIHVRGAGNIAQLYAPALILGGIGLVCLTKSHKILQDRNTALTAAYVAIDTAFKKYRERVIDRYGEETDREFRHEAEVMDVIDEETGKITSEMHAAPGEPSGYARWFDMTNANWNPPEHDVYNRVFLRHQQNWANDMLKSRGHLFLNEVYSMLGLSHTSAGAIVGWLYDRDNDRGDNCVDFGCWDGSLVHEFYNGRDGSILLDFNVDGPIWQLMDERNAQGKVND